MYCGQKYNVKYNASLSRYSSILHTRLRHCALNFHLYRINCANQIPLFVNVDGVKWKLSNITFYIVLDLLPNVNNCMLSLPARLLHPMWMNLSENRKIEILLHGSENLGHEDNVNLM
jgi:hypothetical protein